MKNDGGIGARDVYVDIQLKSKGTKFLVLPATDSVMSLPSKSTASWLSSGDFRKTPNEILKNAALSWNSSFEIRALQPKREVYSSKLFLIGAAESTEIEVMTRTYADTLPEPYVEQLKIILNVEINVILAKALVIALQKEGSDL